jgi:hypothetical protein
MRVFGRVSQSVESGLAHLEGWLKTADGYLGGLSAWRRRSAYAVIVVVAIGVSAARGHSAEHIVTDLLFAALLAAGARSIGWLGSMHRRWREHRHGRYLKHGREAAETRK